MKILIETLWCKGNRIRCMKKMMFGMFTAALLFTACDSDDEKTEVKEEAILAKTEQAVDAIGGELSVEANENLEWWISEITIADSIQIQNPEKSDTIEGDWFTVIRDEEGKFLHLKTNENEEEVERVMDVFLTAPEVTKPFEFKLTQKVKSAEEGNE